MNRTNLVSEVSFPFLQAWMECKIAYKMQSQRKLAEEIGISVNTLRKLIINEEGTPETWRKVRIWYVNRNEEIK